MKKTILFLLFLPLFTSAPRAQQIPVSFAAYWNKVHTYELDALPQSAAAVVDTIYYLANRQDNSPQIIKSLIYQAKFALTLEENAQLSIISNFRQEIKKASFPTKNILESVLAKLYWQYYQQNRWRFYNRTQTANKVDTLDFRTWDLPTIFAEIHTHFQYSLENEQAAKQTALSDFDAIIVTREGAKDYRPSLYDFLAHNALDFYTSRETNLTRPAYKFEIDDPRYFGDFRSVTLEARDSLSLQFNALKIYRKLLSFHESDTTPAAHVMVELERLKFVKDNARLQEADELYLNSLQALKEQYKEAAISAWLDFELATFHYGRGNQYQAGEKETQRFEKAKALQICTRAIAAFPESLGASRCAALQEAILDNNLAITTESYLSIGLPSRLLVDYKNINSLSIKVYRLSWKEQEEYGYHRNDSSLLAAVNRLIPVKEWVTSLRDEKDFQDHQTEVVMPALPQGVYLILARSSAETDGPKSTFAFASVQVTDLALVESKVKRNRQFQVVDRVSGRPVPGAKVQLKSPTNNHNEAFNQTFTTGSEGFMEAPQTQDRKQVQVIASYKGDTAILGSYPLYRNSYSNSSNREYRKIQPFLFTDRSIYRPGQTVYFKGIILLMQEGESTVIPNRNVEVYVEDVNGEEIYSKRLKTNSFGSFSGTFILPSGGLTGKYRIYAEEYYKEESGSAIEFGWSEQVISVEEYRRPTFEADFEPVTATYRVNDTISLSGTAKAFAGNPLPRAKVVYRVQRKVQYPRWYGWHHSSRSFSSEAQEITHGETQTNARGAFTIDFKAIPDPGIDKESLPVFSYEVTADVTDLNGETRSATTLVKVGYHSLLATINGPAKLNKTSRENTFTISSTNLNGEFFPASGRLRVYKIAEPPHVLRQRPWPAPDYQAIPEDEFRKLFPHDPYKGEQQIKNRKKGRLVFDTYFDTEKSKEVALKKLQQWESGQYLMELETRDPWGQEVKDKHRFVLFSPEEKAVADKQLFIIQTDKHSYLRGEDVYLTLGSAAKALTVSIGIEKNHQIVENRLVRLNNTTKELRIPLTEQDTEGFVIHYYFVYRNSFESGTLSVQVADPATDLTIETLTFRDKLQPGEQQSWIFTIKGAGKEKVAAEVLAGMYDASLDQFKPHSWEFTPVHQSNYYSYYRSNGYQSFGTSRFRVRNLQRTYYRYPQLQHEQLNWFGFNFNGNSYANRLYLNQLQQARWQSSVHPSHDAKRKKGSIEGIVTGEDGEPLPGVTVKIKGSNTGTSTDFYGHYSLNAKPGDELVFSFVGFNTATAVMGSHNTIHVTLVEDVQQLQEVVFEEAPEEESMEMSMAAPMDISGQAAGVQIRGSASFSPQNSNTLYIVDGVPVSEFEMANEDILSMEVLKGAAATALYGAKAANGAVVITTRSGQKALDARLSSVKARKNLQETAFFYPHLQTDEEGNIRFTFTAPESLTRWKLQLLAHSKQAASALKTLHTVTQKELMVIPNPPRFLREGDELVFSAKITNLSKQGQEGFAVLELVDALTGKPINEQLHKGAKNKRFEVASQANTLVSWTLHIPGNVQAVQYKVVASAGDFSDGEQSALAVLSNRMLVTETLPIWLRSDETKTFTLDKLKNSTSASLKHHQLSLEMTSNPAWYAVQALPYLMEYPYECAEQTFARYYAHSLASHILGSNPRIKAVFDQWKGSGALSSKLEENQELKSIIIQETPWLRDAKNEAEQKKRIALLFDLNSRQHELQSTARKLEQMQMGSGGFPWFKGSRYPNRYITQHMAAGFGHLNQLKVAPSGKKVALMMEEAVRFLDGEILADYQKLMQQSTALSASLPDSKKAAGKEKDYMEQKHIGPLQIQYLYMRSFYPDLTPTPKVREAIDYYRRQSALHWKAISLSLKAMTALIHHRNGDSQIPETILQSLKESSIHNEELGMYWKENTGGWRWQEAPIETQALLIEAFSEIGEPGSEETKATVDNLKIWLLKHKQTNQWSTTKATTEAVYALLLAGSDWLSVTDMVDITVGDRKVVPSEEENKKVEAGTGYFKTSWKGGEITPDMGEVTVTKHEKGIAWGALYWQYFEDLDKISQAETPLQLSKKLFLKSNTAEGEKLSEVTEDSRLQPGDLLRVRIELKVDRDMDFVHLKDMRASGLEPVNVLSEYKWQDGLGYYESTKDASTNFFIEHLPKGVYVFEYDLRVNNQGNFSNGITTIQSMYTPEFSSHSQGVRVVVTGELQLTE